jgi:hypothetical protein
MKRWPIAAAILLSIKCLPSTTPCCTASQTLCEDITCTDTQIDPLNCGGCGQACPIGYGCQSGHCVCPSSSVVCGVPDSGMVSCVDTSSDPKNCGGCGIVCNSTGSIESLCASGKCGPHCPPSAPDPCIPDGGTTGSCVDFQADPLNCGGCGSACNQGEACIAGTCGSDLVAACFNTDQIFGLDFHSLAIAPNPLVINGGPQSLAFYSLPNNGGTLLAVLDTVSSALYHVTTGAVPQILPGYDPLGATPNQVFAANLPLADGGTQDLLWVVNSVDNNLQAIDISKAIPMPGADGGGRTIEQIPTIPAGAGVADHTNPFLAVQAQNPQTGATMLYVTLYGDCSPAGISAGNKVLEIDPTANNHAGAVTRTYQVASGAALLPPAGQTTYGQPNGIAAANGQLYVALANATGDCTTARGPGFVEVIDIASFTQRALIQIGSNCTQSDCSDSDCANPGFVVSSGNNVYVDCTGVLNPSPPYQPLGAGAVGMIDATTNRLVGKVPMVCPAADGGASTCEQPAPGRMRILNDQLIIGDTANGRLFVVGTNGSVQHGATNAVNLCLAASGQFQLIGDVAVR